MILTLYRRALQYYSLEYNTTHHLTSALYRDFSSMNKEVPELNEILD
jgi:hypothetical protein